MRWDSAHEQIPRPTWAKLTVDDIALGALAFAPSRSRRWPRHEHRTAPGRDLHVLPSRRHGRVRPSVAASSTTASLCNGCATAGGSPPTRSIGSAHFCPCIRTEACRRHRSWPMRDRFPLRLPSRVYRSANPGRMQALRAISASSTIARSICCSSTLAARNRLSPAAARELQNINPRPPAVRVFDAGVGDGTVLARMMRAMHARFPTCRST